jgi:hypothetical protein
MNDLIFIYIKNYKYISLNGVVRYIYEDLCNIFMYKQRIFILTVVYLITHSPIYLKY